jgi:diacylglycerol kinase family enzyme
MYYILYNPLSNGGTCIAKADNIKEKLINENKEVTSISLLDIEHIQDFLNSLNKEDIIILVGGDGTLYHIANEIAGYNINNTVLLAKAGTGNDFYRDVKNEEVDGFVKIDQYITNTPSITVNNETLHFNNSCGMGVDGDICERVNKSKRKGPINYFYNCLKAVLNFKKFKLNLKIDGNEHVFEKTWFTVVMQGKYFGGGMKVAPEQNRTSEDLTVVVVHTVCVPLLICILPTIYSGKHVKFKKYVSILKGKEIEIKTSLPQYAEFDGDITPGISELKITK